MTFDNQCNLRTLFPSMNTARIECGDGWLDLLMDLGVALASTPGKIPRAFVIKQKFGGLRFYTDSNDSYEQNRIIFEFEERSYRICELCSLDAILTFRKGHYQTLCDDCKSSL